MANNKPTDPRAEAERERFRADIRAANTPIAEREHIGPPFPNPSLENILMMRQDSDSEKTAKHDAALLWLQQYCTRARFHLEVKGDLHLSIQTNPDCVTKIDQVRRLLSAEEIDAVLSTSQT